MIARSFSFGPIKHIYLGERFWELPTHQQHAVLRHEEYHCANHHTEWRIVCLLLAPFLLKKLCRRQEFQADAYAADRGSLEGLLEILASDYPGDWVSPSHADRRIALVTGKHSRRVGRNPPLEQKDA